MNRVAGLSAQGLVLVCPRSYSMCRSPETAQSPFTEQFGQRLQKQLAQKLQKDEEQLRKNFHAYCFNERPAFEPVALFQLGDTPFSAASGSPIGRALAERERSDSPGGHAIP
ncbi:MAG TPA: hypothetical protein VJM53_09435 [Burkholderiales bacterium]|nr:hypothetical protein [Burkholderiales bacterium]